MRIAALLVLAALAVAGLVGTAVFIAAGIF